MSLKMPEPWPHPKTGTFYLRVIVPADLKEKAKGQRLIVTVDGRPQQITLGTHAKVSLGTKDRKVARDRFVTALDQISDFWRALRTGPIKLSAMKRHAIAGEVYQIIVGDHRNEPGEESQWMAHRELMEHYLAPDMPREQRLNALDLLVGVQADEAIARRGLRITDDSRMDLLQDVGQAMSDGFGNLGAMARIDYSERRYPKWDTPSPEPAPKAAPITFRTIIDEEVKARSRGLGGAALRDKTITKFRREVKSFTDHRDDDNASPLQRRTIPDLLAKPGIAAVHLLTADAEASGVAMAEQKARGVANAVPRWVLLLEGWGDEAAFVATAKAELAPGKLEAIGGQCPYSLGLYRHQITRTKTSWSAS